jgi:hypothetical protein
MRAHGNGIDWRGVVRLAWLSEELTGSLVSTPAPAAALRQSGKASSLAANVPIRIERHRVILLYQRAFERSDAPPSAWPRVAHPPSLGHRTWQ